MAFLFISQAVGLSYSSTSRGSTQHSIGTVPCSSSFLNKVTLHRLFVVKTTSLSSKEWYPALPLEPLSMSYTSSSSTLGFVQFYPAPQELPTFFLLVSFSSLFHLVSSIGWIIPAAKFFNKHDELFFYTTNLQVCISLGLLTDPFSYERLFIHPLRLIVLLLILFLTRARPLIG